jgi:drug/metabolite transporter (DMT)-like permease
MQTKVGNTSSLIYAGSSVTTFLAGTFFLGEKTSGLKITAVLVAVAGLCMYAPDLLSLSLGVLTGFAAGICDGSANIVRKQLRSVDRNVAVFYQYAVAGVLAAPFILFMGGSPIKEVGAIPIVALLIYTVVSLIFAKLLLHGFSHFDVNAGGVILAVQIFFGMLLGFLVFHEVPSMNELAGSILVFTAVLLAVWGSVRQTVNIGGKQQKPVAINEPT